jgi:Holliday junction resolvase RusA-like endonuclease
LIRPALLTLQPPPSANKLWKQQGPKRIRTLAYNEWTMHVRTAVRVQKFPCGIKHRVILVIGVTRNNMAADIDNRIKPTLDALKHASVYRDDNMVTAVAATWQPENKPTMQVLMVPSHIRATLEYIPLDPQGATGGWFLTALNGEPYGNQFGFAEAGAGRDGTATHPPLRASGDR